MPVVTDPADKISAILIRYAAGDIGPPGADGQIMALLFQQGLGVRKQVRPMKIGIHRKNRGGMIGASKDVKGLMDKIADLHWNDDECRHATCVQLNSGDREDEKAFREWCEMSGVDLAPVDEGSIQFASLACSRGLRSIVSGCESENEELGDGSNYDLEILRKRDKPFATAVEEGMWWLVVSAVFLERYPELVQLWSISRNTAGHVQQPVSEVTGMTLLYTEWTLALEEQGEEPDHDTIFMQVTRGKP